MQKFPLSRNLDCRHTEAMAFGEQHHQEYVTAQPYPHIEFDDFLDPEILDIVLRDLQARDVPAVSYDRPQERLKIEYKPETLPPHTRNLFWFLNSGPFIAFLHKLTGISGLLPDPFFLGGGMHEIKNGGHLNVHADFNRHRPLNVERRINVLIYLNRGWRSEYGGQFEIWDSAVSKCIKAIDPVFNRCVVFNTDSTSYHGNPTPVAHPDGTSRFAIALYYYTASWDGTKRDHTTQFKRRAGTADRVDWPVRRKELFEDLMPPLVRRLVARLVRRKRTNP